MNRVPEADENPVRVVKTEQEDGSNSERNPKRIKQERMITSSDDEVLGIDPEGGDDDDDEEEEFRPRRASKRRRSSRIGDSEDESEEEDETDKGEEGSSDSTQEPLLHRTLSSTKSLPALTSSVRVVTQLSCGSENHTSFGLGFPTL